MTEHCSEWVDEFVRRAGGGWSQAGVELREGLAGPGGGRGTVWWPQVVGTHHMNHTSLVTLMQRTG
jgi:hypothetical protein